MGVHGYPRTAISKYWPVNKGGAEVTRRKKGFTLIEVLAALGIIIVLTLTLVVTIRGQIQRANQQNLQSVMETMNMQIAVAYEQVGKKTSDFVSVASLASAGIISTSQQEQAAQLVYQAGSEPPKFALK